LGGVSNAAVLLSFLNRQEMVQLIAVEAASERRALTVAKSAALPS